MNTEAIFMNAATNKEVLQYSILSVIFLIYYYYFCRRKVVKNIAGDISFRHKHDKYFSNFAEN